MRMAPSEPTYGGMMPLAPDSSPTSAPTSERESPVSPSTEPEAGAPSAEENIRTLIQLPSEPVREDAKERAPKAARANERTEEPTLVRIDRFGVSDPDALALRPFDVESLAAMHRRRRVWLAVSATLAVSALVLLALLWAK